MKRIGSESDRVGWQKAFFREIKLTFSLVVLSLEVPFFSLSISTDVLNYVYICKYFKGGKKKTYLILEHKRHVPSLTPFFVQVRLAHLRCASGLGVLSLALEVLASGLLDITGYT